MELELLKIVEQSWKQNGSWVGDENPSTPAAKHCRSCRYFERYQRIIDDPDLALCANPETKRGRFSKHPIGLICLDAAACVCWMPADEFNRSS